MKAFTEDWSQESMPLQKSKEPSGADISSTLCPKCNKKVRTIGGKISTHACETTKKN